MFILQCETLGLEPESVILSTALLYFDETKPWELNKDPEATCFVKFSFKNQTDGYNRTYDIATVKWWKQQPKSIQKVNVLASKEDVSVFDGIKKLENHVKQYSNSTKEIVWTRGYIHSVCLDSLFREVNKSPLFSHYQYRDIRTAIDMTKETSNNGYCQTSEYVINMNNRHNPELNVIQDAAMLLFGV